MKKFIYKNCVWLASVWALIILILCAIPGQFIPVVSWLELLSFDKWVHAGMFFGLCSLLFIIVIKKEQSKQMFFIYFFSCLIYGTGIEIMQAKCFSNRSADWYDIVANSFGCLIAVFLFKKLKMSFSALFYPTK